MSRRLVRATPRIPLRPPRRAFLQGGFALGGALLVGCSDEQDDATSGVGGATGCSAPPAGGELLGTLPFVGEGDAALETALGSGLDARLYTDLEKLGPETLVIPNEHFYVRTGYPDLLVPPDPWQIAVAGHRRGPSSLSLDALLDSVTPMGTYLLECSGNGDFAHFGMLSAAEWSGIPIARVLDLVQPTSQATALLVSGFDQHSQASAKSTPGASWVFRLDELASFGAFLATEMNGVALPLAHGAPVRLIMPRWYGCTCIKWVDSLRLVDDSEPSTDHMKEFASRTHQDGTPALASDYKPASMDQAAMPVRIERWRAGGEIVHRVVGVMWGGYAVTDALTIRFRDDEPFERVQVCPPQTQNDTWTLWSHTWRPRATGLHTIRLAVDDPAVPTKRLDSGFYARSVNVTEI